VLILRRLVIGALALALLTWSASPAVWGAHPVADTVALQLTDQEFWKLSAELSEPNGTFRSDNLLSNEERYQQILPELVRTTKAGRAYLGVGPEQNFTYIAALKPTIAFIVDIRRGNRDLHLLYKALFEISTDRADFVSRLFSKPRADGLGASSTAADIFYAYDGVETSERLYVQTSAAVRNQLYTRHGFDLADEDLRGIEYVHRAFFMFGPGIRYSPIGLGSATVQPTYAQLMAATDALGQARSFLASEDAFVFVKGLEARNLVVPVVGDFAGPRTVRAVGAYLKQKGVMISTFYVSNVEEYLKRDGIWQAFCENVSTLPIDETSTFIRSVRAASGNPTDGMMSELGPLGQISRCR
jgi:hypothetical protein